MSDGTDAGNARGDRVRIFTLDEANALIPWVHDLLARLIENKRNLDHAQTALSILTPHMRGNGHRSDALTLEREMERSIEQLARGIHEIESTGIQLKDLADGIIDFPALYRGRVVLLCWRLGEDLIAYWHELTDGFAGRRPISEFINQT